MYVGDGGLWVSMDVLLIQPGSATYLNTSKSDEGVRGWAATGLPARLSTQPLTCPFTHQSTAPAVPRLKTSPIAKDRKGRGKGWKKFPRSMGTCEGGDEGEGEGEKVEGW